MAYIYLLNLHDIIDKRLEQAKKSIDSASNDIETLKFLQGRIQALSEFKAFLTTHLNTKLPRKIRQRFNDKSS